MLSLITWLGDPTYLIAAYGQLAHIRIFVGARHVIPGQSFRFANVDAVLFPPRIVWFVLLPCYVVEGGTVRPLKISLRLLVSQANEHVYARVDGRRPQIKHKIILFLAVNRNQMACLIRPAELLAVLLSLGEGRRGFKYAIAVTGILPEPSLQPGLHQE